MAIWYVIAHQRVYFVVQTNGNPDYNQYLNNFGYAYSFFMVDEIAWLWKFWKSFFA